MVLLTGPKARRVFLKVVVLRPRAAKRWRLKAKELEYVIFSLFVFVFVLFFGPSPWLQGLGVPTKVFLGYANLYFVGPGEAFYLNRH
jgi:hypothetical protein